jgi:hypothetical protein
MAINAWLLSHPPYDFIGEVAALDDDKFLQFF